MGLMSLAQNVPESLGRGRGRHQLRGPRLAATPLSLPIGLQLYSVRELLPKDFDGTLHKVAAAGTSRSRPPAITTAPPPNFATPWTRPACAASARTTP
jgi:hypothetical protein